MFDFQNAEINKGGSTPTITPGIHVVKTETVTNGLSTNTQAPFVEFTVIDEAGAKLTNRYYLNTVVNEGKQKSAWDISKNAILAIVAACHSLDEASAKSKMPAVKSAEELAQKLSAICAGKEFKLKVVGEEKMSTSGNIYVNSTFGQGVFAESVKTPANMTKLYFSPDKNIKKLPISSAPQQSAPVADPF